LNLKEINIGVLNKLGEKREKALNSIGIFTFIFYHLQYYYFHHQASLKLGEKFAKNYYIEWVYLI